MVTLLSVLLGLALAAVLGVLITGVVVFARGGQANHRWSNRLMNMRVATQAVAVLILGLIFLLRHFSSTP
ncbi:MAG TPA: twin transmembrane helix small protein [Rhodospirillaceae bacterium]|nr:twin transmembrane helix small protein [Rhodospirillaceae bacterium]